MKTKSTIFIALFISCCSFVCTGNCNILLSNNGSPGVPLLPAATITTDKPAICSGDETATLTINFTGNTPFSFRLYDGLNYSDYTGINAYTYSIAVSPDVTTTYSITWVTDPSGTNFSVPGTATISASPCDFGDAPDDGGTYYHTKLLPDNGARHKMTGLIIGNVIDSEPDGVESDYADGDNIQGADEEGILITPFYSTVVIPVTGISGSDPAYLNGWVDIDGLNGWDNINERIFLNVPAHNGDNEITFNKYIPDGMYYCRFRLSSAMLPSYDGYTGDGEVNDYYAYFFNHGVIITPCQCLDPVPDGMVGWWTFDEPTGMFAHDWTTYNSNPNNGTWRNNPVIVDDAKVDRGLQFDGVNSFVEVPDDDDINFGTDNFSIDTWIQTSQWSGIFTIAEKRTVNPSNDYRGYKFFLSNGRLAFQLADGTPGSSWENFYSLPVDPLVDEFVADGGWHHVAVTVERGLISVYGVIYSDIIFYIDGDQTREFTTDKTGSVTNTSNLRIGLQVLGPSQPYGPRILDEVEMFNRKLEPFEVHDIFEADTCGKCKPSYIFGCKFNDLDYDGVRDDNEPLMGGWNISMYHPGDLLHFGGPTDQDGNYAFVASPTNYIVSESLKQNWHQTMPKTNNGQYNVIVTEHKSLYNVDFGNYPRAGGECKLTISADPPFVCEPDATTLTSTWNGPPVLPTCIEWFQSDVDPGPVLPPNLPWYSIGTGYIKQANVPWQAPHCPTDHWFAARIIDDNVNHPPCDCPRFVSNVVKVQTCKSCPEVTASGPSQICENWTNPTVDVYLMFNYIFTYNPVCNIELWDVTDPDPDKQFPVPMNMYSITGNKIAINKSYLTVQTCPSRLYRFEIRMCDRRCCSVPYEISVIKLSKAQVLSAEKIDNCFKDDDYLDLTGDHCGDFVWKRQKPAGTGIWMKYKEAGTSEHYNTNILNESASYQAEYLNPGCPMVPSNIVTINVLPEVIATLTCDQPPANECCNVLCPTLKMTIAWTTNPPSFPLPSLNWQVFKDDNPVGPQNPPLTYLATSPGVYKVKLLPDNNSYACKFTNNEQLVSPFSADLAYGCLCFHDPNDLEILLNCGANKWFNVSLYKNWILEPGYPKLLQANAWAIITLNDIIIDHDVPLQAFVSGQCGGSFTKVKIPKYPEDGCDCYGKHAGVFILASKNPGCAGNQATCSAYPVYGGTAPSYQWFLNGGPVKTGSSTFTWTPADNDQVYVVMTSNEPGVLDNPATSDTVIMTVNPLLPVGVSVAASANPVCGGTPATFTATPVNGGTNPGYQWKVNGINVTGANNGTHAFMPVNGDIVTCQLTSSEVCSAGNPALSDALTMQVYPSPVPVISGPASVCVNSTGNVYSTQAGMTGYAWNISSGGVITSSSGTNSIIMTESFENGGTVPAGWATQAVSGGNTISFTTATSWPSGYSATNGAYLVRFNSYNVDGGVNRLKRTTPVSTAGYTNITVDFGWLESSGYPGSADKVDVQWSTDGTTWTTAGTFYRYNTEQGWKTRSQALPAAAQGQAALYIAFLFTSCFGNDCYLDVAHVTVAGALPPSAITLGSGTVNCNYPFTTLSGSGRTQLLYTAAQLAAAGASPGSIGSVGFDVISAANGVLNQFNIKIGNTTAASMTGWVTSGMQNCFSGTYTVPGPGWQMIPLQTPFIYDGHGLVVEICYSNPGFTDNSYVRGTTSPAGQIRTYWKDGINGCSYTGANYSGYTGLPNLRFVEQAIGTAVPNAIMITWDTPGANTVTVNYTDVNGCRAAVPTVFNVAVNPFQTPSISGPATVCVNSTGNIYTTQTGMNGYMWSVSEGGTILAGAGTSAIEVTWNTTGTKTVSVNYSSSYNCTSFGPARLYVMVNPLPLTVQTVTNLTITGGQMRCFDADETLIVGGTAPFLVQTGGSVILMAGENIRMLQGTRVEPGGYLHGFIVSNCMWCNTYPSNKIVAAQPDTTGGEPEDLFINNPGNNFFKVYPNPTTGSFTLELSKVSESSIIKVEIYGMRGDKLLNERFTGQKKYDFSLAGKPNGVYFIRVVTGSYAGTGKIIKQ